MVVPFRVFVELRAIKIDFPQVAGAVPFRLIVEVRRLWVAALAARGDRQRVDSIAELNHRHEAVPTGAIPLLRAWIGPRAE